MPNSIFKQKKHHSMRFDAAKMHHRQTDTEYEFGHMRPLNASYATNLYLLSKENLTKGAVSTLGCICKVYSTVAKFHINKFNKKELYLINIELDSIRMELD